MPLIGPIREKDPGASVFRCVCSFPSPGSKRGPLRPDRLTCVSHHRVLRILGCVSFADLPGAGGGEREPPPGKSGARLD